MPTVYIIVNKQAVISQIISNTSKPEVMYVRQGRINGQALSLDKRIISQYMKLTDNGLNCHRGIVYQFKPSKPSDGPWWLQTASYLYKPL